jgi:hypothetical protein
MKHSVATLMDEIRNTLELLESSLPKHIDGFALCPESKLPSKVLRYQECLIWRVVELGRAALHEFEENRFVAGIVLARAVVETSAALWYLRSKVDDAIKSDQVGDIDTYLVKLNVGIATAPPKIEDGEFPRPVRISKFLEEVEKVIEGFSKHYGVLSEFAHPNWAGTVSLYSKYHQEDLTVTFGSYIRGGDRAKTLGVNSLRGAVGLFEVTYNNLTASTPAFVELCQRHSKEKSEKSEQQTIGDAEIL